MTTVRLASLVASIIDPVLLLLFCPYASVCVSPTRILARGILPSQGSTVRNLIFFWPQTKGWLSGNLLVYRHAPPPSSHSSNTARRALTAQGVYFSLLVATKAAQAAMAPMNRHTEIALGPVVEWCSLGWASVASSGLLPGSRMLKTTVLMNDPMNCGIVW